MARFVEFENRIGKTVWINPDCVVGVTEQDGDAFYLVQTLVTQYISRATDKMFGLSFDGEFYWIARLK